MGRYTRALPIIAFLYASLAIASIAPVIYQLEYLPLNEFSHPKTAFVVALPFINALICAGIAYSFLALKNCGRYLAVVYNTSLLGYIFLVITAGIRIGDFRLNGPTVALFIIAGLLLLIILLLLRAERAPERSVATTS